MDVLALPQTPRPCSRRSVCSAGEKGATRFSAETTWDNTPLTFAIH